MRLLGVFVCAFLLLMGCRDEVLPSSSDLSDGVDSAETTLIFEETDGFRYLTIDISKLNGENAIQKSHLIKNDTHIHEYAVNQDKTQLALASRSFIEVIDLTKPNLSTTKSSLTITKSNWREDIAKVQTLKTTNELAHFQMGICKLQWHGDNLIFTIGLREGDAKCHYHRELYLWQPSNGEYLHLFSGIQIADFIVNNEKIFFLTQDGLYQGQIDGNSQLIQSINYEREFFFEDLTRMELRENKSDAGFTVSLRRESTTESSLLSHNNIQIWFENEFGNPIISPDHQKILNTYYFYGGSGSPHDLGGWYQEFSLRETVSDTGEKTDFLSNFHGRNHILKWQADSNSFWFVHQKPNPEKYEFLPKTTLYQIDLEGNIIEEHAFSELDEEALPISGLSSVRHVEAVTNDNFIWHFCRDRDPIVSRRCTWEVWAYTNNQPHLLYTYQGPNP